MTLYEQLINSNRLFEYFIIADPSTSCFAVNFFALDRYSPYVFGLEEIYEKDPVKTTVGVMCPRIIEIATKYTTIDKWQAYYDPAEKWFSVDANARFGKEGLTFSPAQKKPGEKEEGLATIVELIEQRRWFFSHLCPNSIWEFDNYYKDDKGRFVKRNDHTIDNSRYFIRVSGLVIESKDNPTTNQTKRRRVKRYFSLDEDEKASQKLNWKKKILGNYGEDLN